MAVIMENAQVADTATLGRDVRVWELAQIREDAVLGDGCIVGRGAYVGTGVTIGRHVKIQNYALVYEPATLADGVFVGPAAVLTNDRVPRAVDPDGELKQRHDWRPEGVEVAEGASLGARSVCVAPVRIGRWAMVAAGAVVTRDVPDFALVMGVPAKRVGWVGRHGERLVEKEPGTWLCPVTGERYLEHDGVMAEAP
ncbi:acyltransferase [Nonomuraea soli]|uniref:Acetyltransferase-like isoleucine patch superfamily enzyme n=1 Tax=Nonomuraea soli TaxID=1032476 RepID=A0A7W0CU74_9ACTN|nr:acyltransferase [Nonomuraea soli]MBA2897273.1 acetyltransferase-like isoleucine patch superfamily enzyme [Nonomuraea soli]